MNEPFTVNAIQMRGINRSAVLEIIRRHTAIDRSSIARQLNLSLPTVMRIVDGLVRDDLVRYSGQKLRSGGRMSILVEFNPCQLIVGVDMSSTPFYGVVADLGGKIHDEITYPHDKTGEEAYQSLVNLIDALLEKARLTGYPIRGIGVGVPGITRYADGIVMGSTILDWKEFPLKTRLLAQFSMPVVVDNVVNLAAVGELWFGAGQNMRNLVVVTVGSGVGAGIIIDGMVYRGSHQAAGEIGHLLPGCSSVGQHFNGLGAMEEIISEAGIVKRAHRRLEEQPLPPGQVHPGCSDRAAHFACQKRETLSARDVFAAARQGQSWAQGVIDETVDYLAQAVASLSVTFDPDGIILGGGIAAEADLLIEPILHRLEGALPILPNLLVSTLGFHAVVMGTLINLLYSSSELYVVQKLV